MREEKVAVGCLSIMWIFAAIAALIKLAAIAGVLYLLYLAIKWLGGF